MRNLFIVLLFAFSIASVHAQNVGIGETSPANKLSVKGSLSVGSGYSTTAAPANGAIIQGNVGIGTSAPGYNFDYEGTNSAFHMYDFARVGATNRVLSAEIVGKLGAGPSLRFSGYSTTYLDMGQNGTGDLSINDNNSHYIVMLNTNGNVGIGTTTPSSTLQVNGKTTTTNLQMTSGAAIGSVLVSDATGNGTWTSPAAVLAAFGTGTQNYVTKWNNALGTTIGNSQIYDNGTNVGIGTNNTYQTLTILNPSGQYGYNEAQSSGLSVLTGTTTSDYILYMGADKTNLTSYIQSVKWGTATANLTLNARGGNVGIGIYNPSSTLQVNGKTTTTNLQMTSGAAIGYVLQSDASGNGSWVSPSSVATTNTLTNPANTITSTVNGVAATANAVNTVSNSSSTNTLTTTVNGVPGTGVNIINSNVLSLSGTSITATINGQASNALNIAAAANNIYNIDGTLTGNRTATMGANNLTFSSTTGNFIFNPSSTGKAGIGTASPAATLEVSAATTDLLKLTSTSGGAGNHAYIDFVTFSGAYVNARIGAVDMGTNNGSLVFETGNVGSASTITTERMRITSAGLVGVGTSVPNWKMDVAGSIGIANNNNTATNKLYLASGDNNHYIYSSGTSGNQMYFGDYTGFNFVNTGTGNTVVSIQGANAGINTTVPSNMLNVGASNGQGIDIGNPNDQMNVSGGGAYGIRFYGYRDVVNYAIGAKITAQRTYQCCSGSGSLPWLSQGLDLVFYTNNGLSTSGSSGSPNDNSTERLRIKDNGFVGVGTSSPQALLHVSGPTVSGSAGTNRFIKYDQGNNVNVGGSYGGVIAYFNGDVLGSAAFVSAQTFTFSDRRIKNVIGISNSSDDLIKLNEIGITDYTYIDTVTNGSRITKKVIAQDVQKVYPQAVSMRTGFIPDIYQAGCPAAFDSATGQLDIALRSPHKLKAGDKVKYYDDRDREVIATVTGTPSATMFTISATQGYNEVFVYGKQVNDYMTVDYDAISMLNVSATQELAKKLKEEQVKNQALQQQLSALKKENSDTKSDVDKLKASVETLQQLVGAKAQK